jgi:hypothetical protein
MAIKVNMIPSGYDIESLSGVSRFEGVYVVQPISTSPLAIVTIFAEIKPTGVDLI